MNPGDFVYAWFWFDETTSKSSQKKHGVNGKWRYVLLLEKKFGSGFEVVYTTTRNKGTPMPHEITVSDKLAVKLGQKKAFTLDFKRRGFVSIMDIKSVHGSISQDQNLLYSCAKAAKAAGLL